MHLGKKLAIAFNFGASGMNFMRTIEYIGANNAFSAVIMVLVGISSLSVGFLLLVDE